MDTKKVFRHVSNKMLSDFEVSSEIHHNGSKGTYRESSLKKFLEEGRLPKRFAIGSGEIVGLAQNVSKQSDLIIYDQIDGLSLIYDDNIQVYPIESVLGIIEVKSTLNKTELIRALENIKSVKSLVPNETTSKHIGGGLQMAYKRPSPFGAVFGYHLGGNSLDSLVENLTEWEKSVPKSLWPNIIAVLNQGIIFHYGDGLRMSFTNEEILKCYFPSAIHFKADTLFKFYAAIIDLCSSTNLGPTELGRYFEGAETVGKYVVSNHNRLTRPNIEKVYKLTEKFITKIVEHCRAHGSITNKDFFIKRFGQVPLGMEGQRLNQEVYLYNPDSLKGIHEIPDAITFVEGKAIADSSAMEPCSYIVVDDETYYIPVIYITESDVEIIPNMTIKDL